MASNIALGIVIGATTSSSVGRAFHGIDAQASRLGRSLQQVRLGRAASDDVLRYQRQLQSLTEGQRQFGIGNTHLWGQIADTERHLRTASAAAERYGINVGDIVRENRLLLQSENRLAGQLQRTNVLRANRERRSELGGRMLGTAGLAIGAAYAVAGPMKQALSFEHELRLFGNVVNFNNTQLGETKTQLKAIATATNQTPGELLSALNTLAAKGLDPKQAMASLDIIGKTATAAGADVNELATTSFTLIDAMGLKPTELPKAMDMLAQAGKLGSFELKDMATYFPQLTASAKSLGITGTQGIATMGAALQIAMKGASDPAQAANNFQNFLSKLTMKETVTRFKKMGVDVKQVMTEATQKGADPVIAMVEKIKEITGGDKFKMSELFSDMQVLGFLNPMMTNLDEFNRIKKESLAANGVINQDYANMMATGTEQLKAAGIEAQKLSETIGSAMGPALKDIVGTMTPVAQAFGLWAEKNKPLVGTIIGLTAGMIGLKVAILAGSYSLSLMSTAWTLGAGAIAFFTNGLLATRLGLVAVTVQTFAAGVAQKALAIWTGTVTAAQWLWNAALSANPIGLVIIGITAFGLLAYTVYKKWEPIMNWFKENFAWLGTAVDKVKDYAGQVGSVISSVGNFMTTPIIGPSTSAPVSGVERLRASPSASAGKGAVIGGAMAATLALPAGGATPLPPMPAAKHPQSVMYSTNNTIHVTQKSGEDGNALADRIISKMERKQAADKRGALHD